MEPLTSSVWKVGLHVCPLTGQLTGNRRLPVSYQLLHLTKKQRTVCAPLCSVCSPGTSLSAGLPPVLNEGIFLFPRQAGPLQREDSRIPQIVPGGAGCHRLGFWVVVGHCVFLRLQFQCTGFFLFSFHSFLYILL